LKLLRTNLSRDFELFLPDFLTFEGAERLLEEARMLLGGLAAFGALETLFAVTIAGVDELALRLIFGTLFLPL
jgi:hypothetical protein